MSEEEKSNACQIDRCKTYVRGLDERMEGGIPDGSIVLICGHPGTMKSTLAYGIAYNRAIQDKKRCLYITLEQSRGSLQKQMARFGLGEKSSEIDIKDMEDLAAIDLMRPRANGGEKDKAPKVNWLKAIMAAIDANRREVGCQALVIDSLASFYALHAFKNPRADLFKFFKKLRSFGMTVFLVSEIPPGEHFYGPYGVEDFLADGIIHLDAERHGRTVNLYLGVVKMRMTQHDRNYYPLIIEDNAFEIVQD